MKKRPQFDLDTVCNFWDLPPEQIETACKYEYMSESQALRAAVRDRVNKDFCHPHLHRIVPYLDRLSRLCKADCPGQFGFWESEYRIYCSHCNNAVDLPCEEWVKKLFKAVQRRAARSVKSGLKGKKERAKVLPSFRPEQRFRLVLALREVGFPKPWKTLDENARKELIRVIREWDDEQKKSYPPVVIKAGALQRDYQREVVTPVLRLVLSETESRWSAEPAAPESPTEIPFFARQQPNRKYFYGFIRIDEAYNETEARAAFTAWFRDRWAKTKGGGRPYWRAKLNDLVVMRLWRPFQDKPIKRIEHVVKFTIPGSKRAGFKGCRECWQNYCRAKEEKLGFVDEPISKLANEEISGERAEALGFFQMLFPGETPLNY